MSVYPGFGVNYKALQANWPADMAYFKSIKAPNAQFGIRPNMPGISSPWSISTPSPTGSLANVTAFWLELAQYFASDPAFFVTWGPGGVNNAGTTAANWQAYHDAVVACAAYLQSQSILLGDFELGNELENKVDGTTLTIAQLNVNLRQLASDVKVVYSGAVSYGCSGNSTAISDWATNGLGSLDTISIHCYGVTTMSSQTNAVGGFANISTMLNVLGSKCYISEFHVDANSQHLEAISPDEQAAWMQNFVENYILSSGAARFLVYSYVGYENQDNQFAMQNTNGTFNPTWWQFFQSQQEYYGNVYK